MRKTAHSLRETAAPCVALSVDSLDYLAKRWLAACDGNFHSERTIATRRIILQKLAWFLRHEGHAECGAPEIEGFLSYLRHGHKEPGGRWGNPLMIRPVRPRTVRDYHGHLRTFFRWAVRFKDSPLDESPCEHVDRPRSQEDQVEPFTEAEVLAMLAAARKSCHPRRNEALLILLHDTGLRATELCNLLVGDVDFATQQLTVLGKGNKHRAVPFAVVAHRKLYQYLEEQGERRSIDPASPLFTSDRGRNGGCGEPLTRSGLLQLCERLGQVAGVKDAYPHKWRHTFAITFLRKGGSVFALQRMLGHTNLTMTQRYVKIASADILVQHRQFSPSDSLLRGRGSRG